MCCVEHCVTFDAGSKRATVIGVGANKVTADGFGHAGRHLASRCSIQEDDRTPFDGAIEGRELAADGFEIETGRHEATRRIRLYSSDFSSASASASSGM